MKVPEKIEKNKKTYIFVKQINKKIFMYKEEKSNIKECFSLYDLGLVKNKIKPNNFNPEKVIFI